MSDTETRRTLRLTGEEVENLDQFLFEAQSDCDTAIEGGPPAHEKGETLEGWQKRHARLGGLRARVPSQCASGKDRPFNAATISTEPMVVLSTGHLPQGEAQAMDAAIEAGLYSGMRRDEGFLVSTIDDDSQRQGMEAFPVMEGLRKQAREAGVSWLLFDCDAPVLAGLRDHDW